MTLKIETRARIDQRSYSVEVPVPRGLVECCQTIIGYLCIHVRLLCRFASGLGKYLDHICMPEISRFMERCTFHEADDLPNVCTCIPQKGHNLGMPFSCGDLQGSVVVVRRPGDRHPLIDVDADTNQPLHLSDVTCRISIAFWA